MDKKHIRRNNNKRIRQKGERFANAPHSDDNFSFSFDLVASIS